MKSLYRSRGIQTPGASIYSSRHRDDWEKRLPASARGRAARLGGQLDFFKEQKKQIAPDQLVRVKEPVDWQYEVTSRVAGMEKRRDNPALLFESVQGYSTPLLINLFGNVDRISLGLGDGSLVHGSRLDFYDEWNRLFANDIPPVHVGDGPAFLFNSR